jgi:arabinose-5-phosphate isomerase
VSRETARKVLQIEAEAIREMAARLDQSFDRALDVLLGCGGRVVVTGLGKSGIVAQKLSATLASTGTPSLFLHPVEALHGDLGRIVRGDCVVVLSSSGQTAEVLALVPAIKRLGAPLVALTRPGSPLAAAADVLLDVSIREEACPLGLAPTASTTAALAMGDALAMALLERRGFTVDDFAVLHPGGDIGKKLLHIEDVMHRGDQVPRVAPGRAIRDVVHEMNRQRLGMTTVVDGGGRLLGLISDGDLRRQMVEHGDALFARTAEQCMTRGPVTIARTQLATAALALMEQRKITSLPVVDADGVVEGVVHLHDLWQTEMI